MLGALAARAHWLLAFVLAPVAGGVASAFAHQALVQPRPRLDEIGGP